LSALSPPDENAIADLTEAAARSRADVLERELAQTVSELLD